MKNQKSNVLLNNYYDLIKEYTHEQCEKEKKHYKNNLESFENYSARQEQASLELGKKLLEGYSGVFAIIIDEFAAHHDQNAIQELIQGAEYFAAHSQKNTAVEDKTLREMFSYSPELIEKLYQMGVTFLERGQIDEASKVFSFINILDPGYSACWTMLGITLRRENQWEESLKAFDIALEIDEHNGLAYYHAAQCHKELNQMKEARQSLDRALKEISGKPQYAQLERIIRTEQTKNR